MAKKQERSLQPEIVYNVASKHSDKDRKTGADLIVQELAGKPEVLGVKRIEYVGDGDSAALEWLNELGQKQSRPKEYQDSMEYRVIVSAANSDNADGNREYEYLWNIGKDQSGKWETVEGAVLSSLDDFAGRSF